ncbi:ArsR/SmtB family transcription factor [Paramicrobacterium fandaimingii]|uniref:ArsR/SmtB family transcription factor n=1 Tax=Paramicrobacterium fandaimingii TaxID=2708079 RepID=UPI0014246403|nr:ArsR family transcriptional regulator [Microbacterium fandaimingii]
MTRNDIEAELAAETGVPSVPIHLRDAEAIRALAHPARQRVVNLLFADQQTHTSTELSELTGLTPSAMSYHLRALQKAGLVQRAEPTEGDSRTRPWRASGTTIFIHGSEAEGVWEAQDALTSIAVSELRARLQAIRSKEVADTTSYVGISEATLWLTDDEAAVYARALQRAELELLRTGWRNEAGPERRLSRAFFSLLPETEAPAPE